MSKIPNNYSEFVELLVTGLPAKHLPGVASALLRFAALDPSDRYTVLTTLWSTFDLLVAPESVELLSASSTEDFTKDRTSTLLSNILVSLAWNCVQRGKGDTAMPLFEDTTHN